MNFRLLLLATVVFSGITPLSFLSWLTRAVIGIGLVVIWIGQREDMDVPESTKHAISSGAFLLGYSSVLAGVGFRLLYYYVVLTPEFFTFSSIIIGVLIASFCSIQISLIKITCNTLIGYKEGKYE